MNVSEAEDLNTFMRSLTTGATDFQRDIGVAAAERLSKRARQTLGRGPAGTQVAGLVQDLQDAVRVAADNEEWPIRVALPAPPVQNNPPIGDVL